MQTPTHNRESSPGFSYQNLYHVFGHGLKPLLKGREWVDTNHMILLFDLLCGKGQSLTGSLKYDVENES